ncbi:vang-like protein 1 [Oscarella lobularis]|uniref:vang-like protein 1 n=1 Tax=Oscarella lobularis TaxID=121494 RepID=UPI0033139579
MEEEVVEVEVIRQSDDWGVASTISATTASKSHAGGGGDSASVVAGGGGVYFANEDDDDLTKASRPRACDRRQCTLVFVAFFALVSPVVIVLAPLHPQWGVRTNGTDGCNDECVTRCVGFGARLVLLAVALVALFLRTARASGTRVDRVRALSLLLAFLVLVAYWSIFGVVLVRRTTREYNTILAYATSLLDAELFIHYVTVAIVELQRLRARYCVRVTRAGDGTTRHYAVSAQTVQETAHTILRSYYVDFPDPRAPQPYARYPMRHYKNNVAGLKFYDVDNGGDEEGVASLAGSRARSHGGGGRRRNRRTNHDDRYNDEIEHQKKALRRKARLISAAEEAFSVIRATRSGKMNADEAAASIFPSMARPLQKYLRATRQQARHTAESVVNHLARCLQLEMTARAFLQRYFCARTCLELETEKEGGSRIGALAWRLISDASGNKMIERDLVFRLQNSDATLVVEVIDLPELRLVGCPEPAKGFVLKVNSETTV